MTNSEYGLGRLEQFDERSRNYPITAVLPTLAPRSYTWSCGVQLAQGNIGACVGFSWVAELAARPTVIPGVDNAMGFHVYDEAQNLDEWPGDQYQGTSVIAGAKAIQARGHLSEYRWAFGISDLIMAVGYKGPAVLGIPWMSGMFDPDINGVIHATGPVAGGHAILAKGVSISKQRFRLHNSWSANWGLNGDCYISFADLEMLLHMGGEACIPIKRL